MRRRSTRPWPRPNRRWRAGGKERIEAALAELTKASHRLAEALYKGATAGATTGDGAAAGSGGEPKPDGDVIDAEVVDKK